jgi:glycosyltransferase EpsE
VRSLLDQSLRDIEVLVVDDGSTDGTRAVLDGIDDPRLRVLQRPREGRASALAFAVLACRGTYLANLDADDVAFPDRLKEQSCFLDHRPDCGWLGSAEERDDQDHGERTVRTYPETDEAIRRQAAKCIPYCHSAIMFRRAVVEQGTNYDPQQRFLIDFEFFLRVAKRWKLANLPAALVCRRISNASYFQRTFSGVRQNWRLACLGARSVREFRLPAWYYVYPALRLCYRMLPSRAKRHVRAMQGLVETAEATT